MELKTTVKCNKTLKHDNGEISFIKGNTYSGRICNILENLKVTDEQGDDHNEECTACNHCVRPGCGQN